MVKKTILIILISFSFVLPQKKYQGVDETKLIEELQNYGFRFEYALDEEGTHYVLISVDK